MHIVFLIESVSGRIKFIEKVAVCAKFVLKYLSCEEMVVSLHWKQNENMRLKNLLSNTMKTLFFEHKSNALFFVAWKFKLKELLCYKQKLVLSQE